MILIRARLADDVYRRAAVLGTDHRSLDLKFGDRIHIRRVVQRIVVRIGVSGAVQQKCGVIGSSARNAQSADLALANCVLLHGPATGIHSWHQQRELNELASVQGKRGDLLATHYRSRRNRLAIQRRSRFAYTHHFFSASDLELHVQPPDLRNLDMDVRILKLFEASGLDGYRITTRRQQSEVEKPALVAGIFSDLARCVIPKVQLRAFDRTTGRIRYKPK